MTIISTTVSSTASGTYGIPNDIIGQLKTLLLNDSNIIIMSDNGDSNPEVARELIFKHTYNNHPIHLLSENDHSFYIIIYNIANDDSYLNTYTDCFDSGVSYDVHFLYNDNVNTLFIDDLSNSYLQMLYLNINTEDPDGWYIMLSPAYWDTFLKDNSDDYWSFIIWTPLTDLGFMLDGRYYGFPIYFAEDYLENEYIYSYYYSYLIVNQNGLMPYGLHHDTNGDSWIVGHTCLIKDE